MFDRSRAHDVRDALFGGRGAVRVWGLGARALLLPFRAVLACELDPGGSVGAHVQAEYPEIVVFIEGSGTAKVGGAPTAVVPGSVVELALGQTLAIENASTAAPLRYLIIKAG